MQPGCSARWDACCNACWDAGIPALRIDGPHGAPSQHVFEADSAVLIGT